MTETDANQLEFLKRLMPIMRRIEDKHGSKLGDARHKLHVAILDMIENVLEEAE